MDVKQIKQDNEDSQSSIDYPELPPNAMCEVFFQDDDDKPNKSLPEYYEDDLSFMKETTKWPTKAVEILLFHRLRMDGAFNTPKYAKNKLWEGISEYLKESGFFFKGEECHLKYRNMLATYKKNVERKLHKSDELMKWKWFKTFDKILKYRPNEEQEKYEELSKTKLTELNKTKPEETLQSDSLENVNRKWSKSDTQYFLQLRLEMREIFNDPTTQKVKFWRKIAELLQEKGFDVTYRDCVIKWHNLVSTYRVNMRKGKSGTDTIRWEWFDMMSKIHEPIKKSETSISNVPTSTAPTTHNKNSPTIAVEEKPNQSAIQNGSANNSNDYLDNSIMVSDTSQDSYSLNNDDYLETESFDDLIKDDYKKYSEQSYRRSKMRYKSYWRDKLRLQKAAEIRRRREWKERKQFEIQKIQIEKQKLILYQKLTNVLEKFSSIPKVRDMLLKD